MPLTQSGLFVSFEGIDGCGKTTQLQRLASRLRELGIEPVLAQEPGGTRVGRAIRALLLDAGGTDLRPMPELLLYFASRAQNLAEVIQPALEAGRLVLCDRFTDATVAYQGYGRDLGAALVQQLSALACGGARPDLTLWLDLDPRKAAVRVRRRNDTSETSESRQEAEGLEFFLRVSRGYADIQAAEPVRVVRIDADRSPEAVARSVLDAVLAALEGRALRSA